MQKRFRSITVVLFLLLSGANLYAAPKRGKEAFWLKFRQAAAQLLNSWGDVLDVPTGGK